MSVGSLYVYLRGRARATQWQVRAGNADDALKFCKQFLRLCDVLFARSFHAQCLRVGDAACRKRNGAGWCRVGHHLAPAIKRAQRVELQKPGGEDVTEAGGHPGERQASPPRRVKTKKRTWLIAAPAPMATTSQYIIWREPSWRGSAVQTERVKHMSQES